MSSSWSSLFERFRYVIFFNDLITVIIFELKIWVFNLFELKVNSLIFCWNNETVDRILFIELIKLKFVKANWILELAIPIANFSISFDLIYLFISFGSFGELKHWLKTIERGL